MSALKDKIKAKRRAEQEATAIRVDHRSAKHRRPHAPEWWVNTRLYRGPNQCEAEVYVRTGWRTGRSRQCRRRADWQTTDRPTRYLCHTHAQHEPDSGLIRQEGLTTQGLRGILGEMDDWLRYSFDPDVDEWRQAYQQLLTFYEEHHA